LVTVDFNELPEVSKRRFVDASRNPGARVALWPSNKSFGFGWGCLLVPSVLMLLPLIVGLVAAFMDRERSADTASGIGMAGFLAFLVVLAALGMARARATRAAYPYVLGTYVFPTQVVLTESEYLTLYSLADLINVATVNHYVNGAYARTTMTLTFKASPEAKLFAPSIQEAQRVAEALREGQRTLLTALARRDYEALRPLDPLFEAAMTSYAKVKEPGPAVAPLPKWADFGAGLLIAAGSGIGVGLLLVVLRLVGAAFWPDSGTATRSPSVTAPTATTPRTPTTHQKPAGR
jgi:hypothetical protein